MTTNNGYVWSRVCKKIKFCLVHYDCDHQIPAQVEVELHSLVLEDEGFLGLLDGIKTGLSVMFDEVAQYMATFERYRVMYGPPAIVVFYPGPL